MTVIVKPVSDESAVEYDRRNAEHVETARALRAEILGEVRNAKAAAGQSPQFGEILVAALLQRLTLMAVAADHNARTLAALRDRVEQIEQQQSKSLADSYRGAWLPGRFERGTIVTHGGSVWIAIELAEGKPGQSPSWRMMVRGARA